MIKSKNSIKIVLSGTVAATCLLFAFLGSGGIPLSAKANQVSSKVSLSEKELKNAAQKANSYSNEEPMVVVNVVNFGRKNPFKPYKKYSIISGDLSLPSDIPPPPEFNKENTERFADFIGAKVSGILYDSYGKSIAIVNVKGADYMLNKGDSVFGFTVSNISRTKVTLRYGNNFYSVGVGEGIGKETKGDDLKETINYDPVVRKGGGFSNSRGY